MSATKKEVRSGILKIIDLTHPIDESMPVYPGTRPPIFSVANTIEEEGFKEIRIDLCSHTGTHIDVPAHIFPEGRSLDDYDISKFIGMGTVIDLRDIGGREALIDDLVVYLDIMAISDFVLLRTGWGEKWGDGDYFAEHPTLSVDAARWLAMFNIKGVGIDAISIDHISSKELEVHQILLKKDILIIENLTNLDKLDSDRFLFSCAPLRIKGADGSPVRAFAIEL